MNSKYDSIIDEFAEKHYKGQMINIKISDDLREKLIQYGKENYRRIEGNLSSIGYPVYRTCTNYDGVEEVMAMIRGEPYFEYLANEIDNDKLIKVCYYDFLLKANSFELKQFIYGKHYDATFNVLTGNFTVENDSVKIFPLEARMSRDGYARLLYQAIIR